MFRFVKVLNCVLLIVVFSLKKSERKNIKNLLRYCSIKFGSLFSLDFHSILQRNHHFEKYWKVPCFAKYGNLPKMNIFSFRFFYLLNHLLNFVMRGLLLSDVAFWMSFILFLRSNEDKICSLRTWRTSRMNRKEEN